MPLIWSYPRQSNQAESQRGENQLWSWFWGKDTSVGGRVGKGVKISPRRGRCAYRPLHSPSRFRSVRTRAVSTALFGRSRSDLRFVERIGPIFWWWSRSDPTSSGLLGRYATTRQRGGFSYKHLMPNGICPAVAGVLTVHSVRCASSGR